MSETKSFEQRMREGNCYSKLQIEQAAAIDSHEKRIAALEAAWSEVRDYVGKPAPAEVSGCYEHPAEATWCGLHGATCPPVAPPTPQSPADNSCLQCKGSGIYKLARCSICGGTGEVIVDPPQSPADDGLEEKATEYAHAQNSKHRHEFESWAFAKHLASFARTIRDEATKQLSKDYGNLLDSNLRSQVWSVAGSVEWTEADWRDLYESLTAVFTRIAARHAKEKIKELRGEMPTEGT